MARPVSIAFCLELQRVTEGEKRHTHDPYAIYNLVSIENLLAVFIDSFTLDGSLFGRTGDVRQSIHPISRRGHQGARLQGLWCMVELEPAQNNSRRALGKQKEKTKGLAARILSSIRTVIKGQDG